ELVSMMLGATWVTQNEASQAYRLDRGHHTYRVAPGSQRALLQRMIATGRCFLELDEDETNNRTNQRPLRWVGGDAAWKLWLVARQGAGALLVDLQLRRKGKRLSVTEPEVVLGGREGLIVSSTLLAPSSDRGHSRPISGGGFAMAAPFDDRDAYRWVSQFRDHRYAESEAADTEAAAETVEEAVGPSALRVPSDDVPRFFERLYLLPQLPELDLPEGMGRAEALIEPRPHLDLYSPGSAQAAELITGGGKSSLVARVSFDYAGQRINPAQRGRFVPLAPPTKRTNAGDESTETATVAGADEMTKAAVTSEAEETAVAVHEQSPEAGGGDGQTEGNVKDGEERLIRRDLRAEREAIAATAGLGLRHTASPGGDVLLVSPKQMPRAVAALLAAGWVVSADQRIVRAAGPPALSIASGIDWFELRGTVTYDQADGQTQQFSLPEILAAARSGQNMITLGDGSQALLPEQWLDEHGLLTALGQIEGDHLRFKSSQAAVLDALLDDKQLTAVDDRFREARKRLAMFEGIDPLDAAESFGGDLRRYQRDGLGWLRFLREFGMGGILADDMGLGKTVQVLAMLQARKLGHKDHVDPAISDLGSRISEEAGSGPKSDIPHPKSLPSLIVVPRSVIFNWLDEAKKFCPELKVLAYSGPDRAQLRPRFADYDLVVTSFGLMRRDIDALKEIDFDYAVLDEAQAIKNPASQSAKAARLLKARHRLALTGTPVENHLGDLWSIFEFLNPGMLGANARFSELVRGSTSSAAAEKLQTPVTLDGVEATDDAAAEAFALDADGLDDPEAEAKAKVDAVAQVAAALKPFILRRTKTQVLKDLPAKTEQMIVCEMEQAQRKVYDQLRKYYRGTLMKQLDASPNGNGKTNGKAADASGGGVGSSAFMVLEALLRLRQAACHPALIDKEGVNPSDGAAAAGNNAGVSSGGAPSAKLDTLSDMLAEVIDGGQKALVFSQFTSMLSLVRQRLDELGIRYAYLDGQTRNRKQVVEQFQEDPDLQVFLISLKAGGVGLNLTAAEYVFILDPWWNPAVEAQAIDRTHRIGQTKPVFAYRMICEDTVEQRIIELQQRKRQLADAIVGGQQNLLQSLTRSDIEQLLS
ncbi:MAG: DEAD/DEAH box helicase, partial [Planctomycetota bacterium]